MDQDSSTQAQDSTPQSCGCTAGADGGPCDACKAGKHHECTSDSCTMRNTPPAGGTSDQA